MTSSVSQATLDALARRLDELAADFPTSPADVDPVALTDHIGLLAHHLDHLTGQTQDRLATTRPPRGSSPARSTPPPAPS